MPPPQPARCQERAEFVLRWENREGHACDRCLVTWLRQLVKRGPVTVEKIEPR